MKIFLDACIVIYWVESAQPFYSHLLSKFQSIANKHPDHALTISRLSILECLVKPLREQNKKILDVYQQFFESPEVSIIEIDQRVIEIATQIRAQYLVRTPDAIQVASCLSLDEPHLFLTNDQRLTRISHLQIETL